MPVTLIGYRGCGKSTVGPLLARQLEWAFVDADEHIEQFAGQSIHGIFAEGGEAEFRRIERIVMQDLLSCDKMVIAAGGGAVLNEDTRRDLRESGPVVWLRADVETLMARITSDPTTGSRRPDLTPGGGKAEVETLLTERTPLYESCATLTYDTDALPPEEIVQRISHDLRALGEEAT